MQNVKLYRDLIIPGMRFDTYYETNCLAQSKPNTDGIFNGLDSDGVEVEFRIEQVSAIYPVYPLKD